MTRRLPPLPPTAALRWHPSSSSTRPAPPFLLVAGARPPPLPLLGLSTSRARTNIGQLGLSSFHFSSQAANSNSAREPIGWLGFGSDRACEPIKHIILLIIFYFIQAKRMATESFVQSGDWLDTLLIPVGPSAILVRKRGGTKRIEAVAAGRT